MISVELNYRLPTPAICEIRSAPLSCIPASLTKPSMWRLLNHCFSLEIISEAYDSKFPLTRQ